MNSVLEKYFEEQDVKDAKLTTNTALKFIKGKKVKRTLIGKYSEWVEIVFSDKSSLMIRMCGKEEPCLVLKYYDKNGHVVRDGN